MQSLMRTGLAAFALAALLSMTPLVGAKATTYNANLQTTDQTNGFDFNLVLNTDGSNQLTGASGSVTGLGTSAIYSGAVTGYLASNTNPLWNWDNQFFGTAPYFSNSPCCSGIVLSFGASDLVNLYLNTGDMLDYASFLAPGGSAYIPGLEINLAASSVSAVPLPSTLSLFGAGLFGLCVLGWRKKQAQASFSAA